MGWPEGKKMTPEHRQKIANANRGQKRSMEARRNMSLAAMGKAGTNKGREFSPEWREKIGKAHRNKIVPQEIRYKWMGENSSQWKGDDVKYRALHAWVVRHLGAPRECEHCGTTTAKKFEWANKSHQYLRELGDWIRLCTSCHRRYDGLIIE